MKFYLQLCSALILLSTSSCINGDDFELPDLTISEPELEGEVITITALANAYEQAVLAEADDIGIFDFNSQAFINLRGSFRLDLDDSTNYIEGFVISSDEAGNYFEEVIIQDAPENPQTGVRVLIDESPLFTFYEVGRKIFIKLSGLHIGDANGVLTLGVGTNLDKIPAPLQQDFITRSPEIAEIIPTPISILDFANARENTFILLSEVQFTKAEVVDATFTFAGEPADEFDGERTLIGCDNSLSVILSTSTFADFKSIALPSESGSIAGTLTRNFQGETYNLVINTRDNINFDLPDRCDPPELNCGLADEDGEIIIFEDDFETQEEDEPIMGNGWTNYQEAGSLLWEAWEDDGTNASLGISARVGSRDNEDDLTISWLITPQLELTTFQNATLEFKTSTSFADGSNLEVLFSSDWNGAPESIPNATWEILSAAVIAQNEDFFGDFIDSERINLSCAASSGYVAFKYTGSGSPDFDGIYELDDIVVTDN